jgi:hypothetical protein
MLDMPIMEPPGGDCFESWVAAAWMVLYAPVRLVLRVAFQSSGVILGRC